MDGIDAVLRKAANFDCLEDVCHVPRAAHESDRRHGETYLDEYVKHLYPYSFCSGDSYMIFVEAPMHSYKDRCMVAAANHTT
jgi:hypothetical protein